MKTLEHSNRCSCFLSTALGIGSRPTCPKFGLYLQLQHDFPQLLLRTPPWASYFPFDSINSPGFPWNLWSGCLFPLKGLLLPLCLPTEPQVSTAGTGVGPRPCSHPTHSPLPPFIPTSSPQLAESISWLINFISHPLSMFQSTLPAINSRLLDDTGPLQMLLLLSGTLTHTALSPTQTSDPRYQFHSGTSQSGPGSLF